MFWIAQAFGVVAMATELISYQFRKKQNLLICDIIATIFYGIQYFLLGAISGCWVQILVLARSICILVKDRQRRDWNWLFYVFIALYLLVGIFTFDAWYSILAVLASMIFLISTWKFKDTQKIRYWSLPAKTLWLVYNTCVLALPNIIANVCQIGSIIVGIIRNKKTTKKRTKKRKAKS